MVCYFRPLVRHDTPRTATATPLAGGALWFDHCARHDRDGSVTLVPAGDVPAQILTRLTAPRAAIAGLAMDRTRIMGILNVTPDSFSDGGLHAGDDAALDHARKMMADGAEIIDIGGESTRPGAALIPDAEEAARITPTIRALAAQGGVPVSVDTRKSAVAQSAIDAGAAIVNDVSGLTHDPALADYCAAHDLPICIMHTQGDPQTMQDDPRYDDVLLDVYDFLEMQIRVLEAKGLSRKRIIVDPGIGFGKTLEHNLALLQGLSLFHALGCPVLLGASRKRFIGTIGGATEPAARMPGSLAVALGAAAQGVQIVRVHDVSETRQALRLWTAIIPGAPDPADPGQPAHPQKTDTSAEHAGQQA